MNTITAASDRPRIGIAGARYPVRFPWGDAEVHGAFTPYVRAICAAGGLPFVLPQVQPHWAPLLLSGVHALVLTGGPDMDPAHYGATTTDTAPDSSDRDRTELGLVHAAMAAGLPILGVCRGLHVLNVALGGSLLPHIDGHLGRSIRHRVQIEPDSTLAALAGSAVETGSLHHQAVDRAGAGLRAVAFSPDGTIEALEAGDGAAVIGVQWHPEINPGPAGDALFRWIVETAAARASCSTSRSSGACLNLASTAMIGTSDPPLCLKRAILWVREFTPKTSWRAATQQVSQA